MAKTLVLVRHSKAEERGLKTSDINRPLTEKGKADTFRMADFLLKTGIEPDLILSSTATRAKQTAEIFLKSFRLMENNLNLSKTLYYSTAKTILDHLYVLPETVNTVIVVAHNPGISDLARGLSSGQAGFMENTQASILKYEIEKWYQLGDNRPSFIKSHKVNDTPEIK